MFVHCLFKLCSSNASNVHLAFNSMMRAPELFLVFPKEFLKNLYRYKNKDYIILFPYKHFTCFPMTLFDSYVIFLQLATGSQILHAL